MGREKWLRLAALFWFGSVWLRKQQPRSRSNQGTPSVSREATKRRRETREISACERYRWVIWLRAQAAVIGLGIQYQEAIITRSGNDER